MAKNNKKIGTILLLMTALFIVMTNESLLTEFYVAVSDLNIRTGAGMSYPAKSVLDKGNEVKLLSTEEGWSKIKYLNDTGYVSSKYLKFSRSTYSENLNTASINRAIDVIPLEAIAIFLLFIGYILYGKIRDTKLLNRVTDKSRGTKSERGLVLKLLKSGVSGEKIFHDLYVEKRKGDFSQTDLVILTNTGIIVFEVKDYSGWIYGNGNQSQWTQVLAYGKQKYYFYNPIMQNNSHIAELRKKISLCENIPFYSIIVFSGDCVLRNISFVPNETFVVKEARVMEVVAKILRDYPEYIYQNENQIIRILKEAVINGGNVKHQIQHINRINNMLGRHRVFD